MTAQIRPAIEAHRDAERLKAMLEDVIQQARHDILLIDDPRAKALFETTAEVLTGLKTAFDHYEQGTEPGWR